MDFQDPQFEKYMVMATRVFSRIGHDRFGHALIDFLDPVVPVDHCAVFSIDDRGNVGHVFTVGKMDQAQSDQLASDYISSFYNQDPTVRDLISGVEEYSRKVLSAGLDNFKADYDPAYQDRFFDQTNLIDKAASIGRARGAVLYCNFYRMKESGPYSEDDWQVLQSLLPALTALIVSHYNLCVAEGPEPKESSGDVTDLVQDILARNDAPFDALTSRERQVCEGILLGYTSEALGLDLNIAPSSVATYRKRAYEKLGITSQNELFRLCLESVSG